MPKSVTPPSVASCASWRGPRLLLGALVLAAGSGCSSDRTTSPAHVRVGAAQTFWTLQLNQHALNLATVAPANTFHLTATPLNPAGVPLTGLGLATFRVVGDTTVVVDPTGLVTAHSKTQGHPTTVIASLTAQNYTLADTVLIQVTDTIPHTPLGTFSIQAASGDSAKRSVDYNQGRFAWPVTIDNPALLVYYTSSNPIVATIDRNTGAVTANDSGTVTFTATTVAYGVVKADSVRFRIGLPLFPTADCDLNDGIGVVGLLASPPTQLAGVGAVVSWVNFFGDFSDPPMPPYGVIFEDTTNIAAAPSQWQQQIIGPPTGSGNIPLFTEDDNFDGNPQSRAFPVAGTYHYHCIGTAGAISTRTYTILVQPG